MSSEDFNWENYLYLAKWLSGDTSGTPSNHEGLKRNAISRSYYAALLTARDFLLIYDDQFQESKKESHVAIIDAFRFHPERIRKTIGQRLNEMKRRRIDADYITQFPVIPQDRNLEESLKYNLEKAEQVISAVKALVAKSSGKPS